MSRDPSQELADAMRVGMRKMAQTVSVVSLKDGQGARLAMTASSVTSVSAEPASMLVCVNRTASLFAPLTEKVPFCINVLAQGMEEISNLCAGQAVGEERFALGAWNNDDRHDLPFLSNALVNFFCTTDTVIAYGTHLVCIGRLTEVRMGDEAGAPLLYYNGRYRSL